jgi:hypothetical protein
VNPSHKYFVSEGVLCLNSSSSKEFLNRDVTAIHNINTRNKHTFIDQMPTFFKKVHFMLA